MVVLNVTIIILCAYLFLSVCFVHFSIFRAKDATSKFRFLMYLSAILFPEPVATSSTSDVIPSDQTLRCLGRLLHSAVAADAHERSGESGGREIKWLKRFAGRLLEQSNRSVQEFGVGG